jgi:hypothetical protein
MRIVPRNVLPLLVSPLVLIFCFAGGFQLAAHSSSSASAVTATPSSDDQKTAPSSSSSAPRLLLSYISNHHYLKAVPLDSVPSGLTYGELRRNGGRVPKERPRTVDLLTHRIEVAKGSSHVLAYLYDAPTRTFITLNGDAKIKIFALESGSGAAASGASKSPGRLLKKYRHIAGSFKLGYPYILKKIGADLIFYTADEGVYLLRIG